MKVQRLGSAVTSCEGSSGRSPRPPSPRASGLRRSLSLHVGSVLLRSTTVRAGANWAYQRLGPRATGALNVLFGESRIGEEFRWRCEFRGRTFLLPVFPELPRSWHNARMWQWGGNRSIRRFYECYLRDRPEGMFFDVGANDGIHTYPFAVAGYRCICFEPQEACVQYIRRVCGLNGFESVSVENAAVSNEDCESLDFFVGDSSWYSSVMRQHVVRWGDIPRRTTVRSVTLDSYCRAHNLRPTLIKIDVEEAEWDVLDGARDTFRRWRPDVVVEVSADSDRRERIWSFFEPLGHACYSVQADPGRPLRLVAAKAEFVGGDGMSAPGDYVFVDPSRITGGVRKLLGLTSNTSPWPAVNVERR